VKENVSFAIAVAAAAPARYNDPRPGFLSRVSRSTAVLVPAMKEVAMPAAKLKEFLDAQGVKYVSIRHSTAYTAQEIAASAHVRGREMAKTVIVRLDGRLAMAVLPASPKVDVQRLRDAVGAKNVEIVGEQDFRDAFPGCEVGAMPPFGNLYGMEVYVDPRLSADEEIAFNAGTHTELIRMSYRDFERLTQPKVVTLAKTQ
jgi:Ala-tRNA(Pro) deacylase